MMEGARLEDPWEEPIRVWIFEGKFLGKQFPPPDDGADSLPGWRLEMVTNLSN